MKSKWIWLVSILIIVLVIGSAILVIKYYPKNPITKEDIIIKKATTGLKLEELPENYTEEQAIADGCFVIKNTGDVYNAAKLEAFIENTSINKKERKEDTLRIVRFTIEGDMTIVEISFHIQEETYLLRNRRGK